MTLNQFAVEIAFYPAFHTLIDTDIYTIIKAEATDNKGSKPDKPYLRHHTEISCNILPLHYLNIQADISNSLFA